MQARGQRCMGTSTASSTFIGTLAMALCSHTIQICLPTLQKILRDKGLDSGKDMAQLLRAASRYWEDSPHMQQAIAAAFTGQHDASLSQEPSHHVMTRTHPPSHRESAFR